MRMTGTSVQILMPKFRDGCILSQGIEIGDLIKVRKETIMFVHPCSSERGKLMADIELTGESDNFIDPETLCSLLEIHRRHFAELRCSPKLGVAKFMWKGREISVFKNGKIKIQRALDRDEILRIAANVSRLIWGAAICDVCGQPALNCASGRCGKCASEYKTPLRVSDLQYAELLQEGFAALERAKGSPPEESEGLVKKARYLALQFILEAGKKDDAILGFMLLAQVNGFKSGSNL